MNVLTSGILKVGFHLKMSFRSFHDVSQREEFTPTNFTYCVVSCIFRSLKNYTILTFETWRSTYPCDFLDFFALWFDHVHVRIGLGDLCVYVHSVSEVYARAYRSMK